MATALALSLASAATFLCNEPNVHDGDSLRCGAGRIRIANIEAPELPGSPKCEDNRRAYAWCDYEAGYRARDALQAFLSRGQVKVEPIGTDKYGRTLALVTVNRKDAGAHLIGLGLARRWR